MASGHPFSAKEAAKAVNELLRLDNEKDQDALLEVLDSYFHPPNHTSSDSSGSDCSDLESEPDINFTTDQGANNNYNE